MGTPSFLKLPKRWSRQLWFALTRWNDLKNTKKREKKVDKTLAKKRNLLYNIIIKLKKERLIILYEGRENLPTKKLKNV